MFVKSSSKRLMSALPRWLRRTTRSRTLKISLVLSRTTCKLWLKASENLISSYLLLQTCNTMKILLSMKTMLPSTWLNLKSISLFSSLTWLTSKITRMLLFLLLVSRISLPRNSEINNSTSMLLTVRT